MARGYALPVAIAMVLLGVATIVCAQPATKIARIGWLDKGDMANTR